MAFNFKAGALAGFLVLVSGCYEGGYDRSVEYGKVPAREKFIGSVYFATGSSALTRAASADLGRMANRMNERKYSGTRVVLVGYADRKRGVEENSELAAERAQRVAIGLEKHGIELDRILIDSRSVRLTRPNDGERRVDLFFEGGFHPAGNTLYPVLVAFFLLCTFAVAVIIFRRR